MLCPGGVTVLEIGARMSTRGFAQIGKWMVELLALVAALWVVGRSVSDQWEIARSVGNSPSALADGGSDHDALVSGMHYYVDGFTNNYGLPNRAAPIGKMYMDPADKPKWGAVYTHYPPGPNWLTGVGFYIFGPNHVPLYRSIPIAFSALCFMGSYFLLRRALGALLAAVSLFALFSVPMTSSMMHGLHSHGYASAILVLQTSYVFSCFRRQGLLRPGQLALVFVMGWIQGWVGFDYAFVASFYPLALAAICFASPVSKAAIITTIAAAGGFAVAHIAHFGQVALYRQSWGAAYSDFFDVAAFRLGATESPATTDNGTLHILQTYLIELLPAGGVGDWPALYIIGTAIAMAVFYILWARLFPSARQRRTGGVGLICGLVMALVISVMWELVMQQHALVAAHKLFLPRHLLLFLFVCILSSSIVVYEIAAGLWARFFDNRVNSCRIVGAAEANKASCTSPQASS